MFENFKMFKDLLKNGANPDEMLKGLGLSEEDSKVLLEKLEKVKEEMVKGFLSGVIKTQDDVMNLIKNSGIITEEAFNSVMEKIKENEPKEK